MALLILGSSTATIKRNCNKETKSALISHLFSVFLINCLYDRVFSQSIHKAQPVGRMCLPVVRGCWKSLPEKAKNLELLMFLQTFDCSSWTYNQPENSTNTCQAKPTTGLARRLTFDPPRCESSTVHATIFTYFRRNTLRC